MHAEALENKLLDPDEKIRAAVCRLYAQLDFESTLHFVTEKQLRGVADRCMDKKVLNVRLHISSEVDKY